MNRRSEQSHELTPEERSRGGLKRAATIRTAKLDAMAEGRPYKSTRRRRRRPRNSWGVSDPYARVDREPEPETPPASSFESAAGPGWSAYGEALELANERGGIEVDLGAMFRTRDRELIDP